MGTDVWLNSFGKGEYSCNGRLEPRLELNIAWCPFSVILQHGVPRHLLPKFYSNTAWILILGDSNFKLSISIGNQKSIILTGTFFLRFAKKKKLLAKKVVPSCKTATNIIFLCDLDWKFQINALKSNLCSYLINVIA